MPQSETERPPVKCLNELQFDTTYWVIVRPRSTDNIEVVEAKVVNRDPGAWVSIKTTDGRIFDCFGDAKAEDFHAQRETAIETAVSDLQREAEDCDSESRRLQIRSLRLRAIAKKLRQGKSGSSVVAHV